MSLGHRLDMLVLMLMMLPGSLGVYWSCGGQVPGFIGGDHMTLCRYVEGEPWQTKDGVHSGAGELWRSSTEVGEI